MKVVNIKLSDLHSYWYNDILQEWHPNPDYIDYLVTQINTEQYISPILAIQENDSYVIVNGHHRVYAYLISGQTHIKGIVINGSFDETEPLRKAEVLLKSFDKKTNYKYHFSGYLDRWATAKQYEIVNQYRPPRKSTLLSFYTRAVSSIHKHIARLQLYKRKLNGRN